MATKPEQLMQLLQLWFDFDSTVLQIAILLQFNGCRIVVLTTTEDKKMRLLVTTVFTGIAST